MKAYPDWLVDYEPPTVCGVSLSVPLVDHWVSGSQVTYQFEALGWLGLVIVGLSMAQCLIISFMTARKSK